MKQLNWFKVLVGMLVGFALLAPSSAAFAAEQSGTGTITAKGVGYARIEGNGTVVVKHGAGTIWVTGASDIQTSGRGRKTTLADGTIRLTGYSGDITITGTALVVRIEGGAINLSASGTGSALLKGRGSYTAGELTGTWAKAGVTVQY
jgi:hypothetical protein